MIRQLNPRHPKSRLLAPLLGALLLSLALLPVPALADETTETTGAPVPVTGEASPSTGPSSSPPSTPTVSSEATSTAPASESAAPQVQAQTQQAPSRSAPKHAKSHPHPSGPAEGEAEGGTPAPTTSKNVHAPSPSALTPPLPSALGSSLGGVPDFFIANFPLPPFLLPIYQAAGRTYGIPWQVLAAINEVETDYGRDLSISSAGAEGWMQFLPSSWAQYGVDANGDGFADPYNPADAIFAAARYLKAAGGGRHIREAIFAYNHSQSYVASVLLRAQLLQGTPPQLLGAIADLAEARFPVHAPSQFSDGFPTVPGHPGRPLVATAIDSAPGAPVIAVQDGTITAIGRSGTLGRYVKLIDAYGDIYTYGELGSVATLYPVLTPHAAAARRGHIAEAGAGVKAGHAGVLPPASAGVQPRSPVTAGAVSSGLALGAAAALESDSVPRIPTPLLRPHARRAHLFSATPRVFRAGHEDVSLHPLRVGSQVIAGTVIGHLGSVGEGAAVTQASMVFQIRPNGVGAPLIDPKPILDGWVRLEGSLIYRATGKHRFPSAPPALHGSKLPPKGAARLAAVLTPTLTPGQWLQLTAHLGTIPDPVVAAGHSPASIPTAGNGNGNH
jgi:murein DD-endopeptidase MepM/ murein hydrolase activator NlpD